MWKISWEFPATENQKVQFQSRFSNALFLYGALAVKFFALYLICYLGKFLIPKLACFNSHVFFSGYPAFIFIAISAIPCITGVSEGDQIAQPCLLHYICVLFTTERREQYQTILFTLFFLGTKQLQERYSGEYWTSGQSALYFACFAARLQICNAMSILFVDFIYQCVDFIYQCNIRIYSNKLSNCKIHQTQ